MAGPRREHLESIIEDSVLIERAAVVDLYTGFEKVLRFVGGLLYTVSKRAGKLTAQRMREKGLLEDADPFQLMMTSFLLGGYADSVTVEKVEKKGKEVKIRLRVEGTLLGSRLKGRKRTVDQPLVGYLAGWLEEAYGVRVDGRETDCIAKGAEACRFELRVHGPLELEGLEGKTFTRPRLRIELAEG